MLRVAVNMGGALFGARPYLSLAKLKPFGLIIVIIIILFFHCSKPDKEPPVLEITYPVANALLAGTVVINVNAEDNNQIDSVVIFIDQIRVICDTDEPYEYIWDTRVLPDRSVHQIYARGFDPSLNEGLSNIIQVEVDNNLDNTPVFIWNFDPNDVFYDSSLNREVDCAYYLGRAIQSNGYNYDMRSVLTPAINTYNVIFITLGWFRC